MTCAVFGWTVPRFKVSYSPAASVHGGTGRLRCLGSPSYRENPEPRIRVSQIFPSGDLARWDDPSGSPCGRLRGGQSSACGCRTARSRWPVLALTPVGHRDPCGSRRALPRPAWSSPPAPRSPVLAASGTGDRLRIGWNSRSGSGRSRWRYPWGLLRRRLGVGLDPPVAPTGPKLFTAEVAMTAKDHHFSENPGDSIVQNFPAPLSYSHL
jgi:hypothetical protein